MRPLEPLKESIELLTPTVMVVGAYLLVSGHDHPGGGFIAGLVLATIPVMRHAAGMSVPGRHHAAVLLGLGVVVAGVVLAAPLLVGVEVASQTSATVDIPLFGAVKFSTILAFDIGVTLTVTGLVLGLLDRLGEDPTP